MHVTAKRTFFYQVSFKNKLYWTYHYYFLKSVAWQAGGQLPWISLSLSLSHKHTLSLSFSHTHSLSLSLTHTLSHTHSLSHTHARARTLSFSHTLFLSLFLSHTHTHTHTLSFFLTHAHSLSFSHSVFSHSFSFAHSLTFRLICFSFRVWKSSPVTLLITLPFGRHRYPKIQKKRGS